MLLHRLPTRGTLLVRIVVDHERLVAQLFGNGFMHDCFLSEIDATVLRVKAHQVLHFTTIVFLDFERLFNLL